MKKNKKPVFFWLISCMFLCCCFSVNADAGTPDSSNSTRRMHTVYFENTDYELHVYKIFGHKKGNTIMILGGIQGDEPGGFLTADSYAGISLEKGTIIVVPRANLPSILMQKRQVNVDMNRKFADEDSKDYEGKIVKILKELISKSDCLLNLHDGSGFFSPVWVNDMKNPMRFGQSIIADFKKYKMKNGEELDLEEIAKRVVLETNKKIKNKDYEFKFNNHRTSETNSLHKEQRKSATYFAVTKCDIPAFGIETSKSLSILQKVKHHQYAINAFLEEFGVVQELPPLVLEKPELKYLVVSVNKNTPVVLKKGETLSVLKGSVIRISHVEANYDRGLTVDFIDMGKKNDIRTPLTIDRDVRVVARKDYEPCGSIYIRALDNISETEHAVVSEQTKGSHFYFRTRINNNEIRLVENGGDILLEKGDLFEIIDVETGLYDPSDLEVNIKGYVSNRDYNTGEDRGSVADTGKDFWLRYSLNKKGLIYPVVVSKDNKKVGNMFIKLKPPLEKFLILRNQDRSLLAVSEKNFLFTGSAAEYELKSVAGISVDEFKKGRYLLMCNGKVLSFYDEKITLDSIFKKNLVKTQIKLVHVKNKEKKIEARFNIEKIKEL